MIDFRWIKFVVSISTLLAIALAAGVDYKW